jgi:hypothetical protein
MELKIGDRKKARINYGGEGGSLLPMEEGTVVYVHPEGRFYTLEFNFDGAWGRRSFRESYILDPPPGRVVSETPNHPFKHPGQRDHGWHSKQNGALGRYLETM